MTPKVERRVLVETCQHLIPFEPVNGRCGICSGHEDGDPAYNNRETNAVVYRLVPEESEAEKMAKELEAAITYADRHWAYPPTPILTKAAALLRKQAAELEELRGKG